MTVHDSDDVEGTQPEVASRPVVARRRGFREWPLLTVCLGIGGGLAYLGLVDFKQGSMIVAVFVCLAAFLRIVLPERTVGLLAVRSRVVDVLSLLILGLALAIITVVVPHPGGQ
ncbi:MAG: DUF3017 domain-containing protein [Streptosporangiales bacterium]|nr:DUF3017 domain-containing protein [Streptosporangiales bacterium]